MRSWIGKTFGAMAFLLFGVIVGLWVRSQVTADRLYASAPPCPVGDYFHTYGLTTWKGRVVASRVRVVSKYARPEGDLWWDAQPADFAPAGYQFEAAETWLGFGATTFEHGRAGTWGGREEKDREWDVQIPLWALALLWGVPAGLWVRSVRRRTRGTPGARVGLCPGCGYDLRASTDRCPECGRTITAPRRVAQSSWRRELRPLAVAVVLLLAITGLGLWGGYSRVERSRLAWAEHDRLDEAKAAAEDAIHTGDAAALEAAFRAGAVIPPAEKGEIMLRAIDNMSPEIARVLIEHGADLTVGKGRALVDAMSLGEMDLARCLVEHGADVRALGSGPVPVPALNIAVECRAMEDLELVRRLLERGADPNGRGEGSMTPLTELMARCEPTENGRALLELLLEYGADVNLSDGQGLTPLNWIEALPESNWQRDLAAFLRSRGAKPHRPFEK